MYFAWTNKCTIEVNRSVYPLRESTTDAFAKAAIEKKLIVLRLIQYIPPL